MPNFPHYHQPDAMDCGATCLRIIAKHYGKSYSLPELRTASHTTREGASLLGLTQIPQLVFFRLKSHFKKIHIRRVGGCPRKVRTRTEAARAE